MYDTEFSLIKTDEYSLQCLEHYYINKSNYCPITDIKIEKEYTNDYSNYFYKNNSEYIYYTNENKLGKLYKSFNYSEEDIFDINKFAKKEFHKLSNPIFDLKIYMQLCDAICFSLIIASLLYSFFDFFDKLNCNKYFKISNVLIQIILFILYIIRFDKFIDIKNFLFDNKDIYMDESYFPNKIFNIDSFPIAVIINFFIYNFLYSFFTNKKSCLKLRENIFEFGSSNKELAIIFNLYMIPLFVSFFIFGVFDLVNTSKIINTYGNLLSNWKFHPIKSISSEIKEEEKINYSKYFSSGRNKNSIELKNIILNLERFDDYDYFNIYSNKTGRICGKDNFGNNLYFPKDVDCPINEIFISQYYLYTTDYDQIKISDNEYLYYTKQNTQGNIIIDLGVNSNLEELNSDYTFPLYEEIYYENNFNKSFLYSTNYIGLNLSSFTEKESEKINDFRNNFDKYKSFYDCKIAFILIDNFFIILYSSLVFKRECERDNCCTFCIIFLFSAIKIIYFIISIINFLFQKEYINGFLYKINYDFSLKKRNLDFDIIIIIYSIILLSFSILTSLMTCFYIKLFELKKEKKEKDNPNETRINNEKPAIKDDTSEISLKTKMNEMKDEIKEKEEEINELNENITNLNEKNEKILNEKNNEI